MVVVSVFGINAQAQLLPNFGEARSGTAGFQFSKIIVDPRGAAMGGSNIADASDASSLFWNPALSARLERSEFMLSHTEYVADINYDYLSYVHRINNFAIGGSIQFLGSGDIIETTEFEQTGTGRTFSTSHFSVGLSAAQNITEYFSYGLTFRYLRENIAEVSIQTAAIDFGFFYEVPDTDVRFAVGINNFGLDGESSGTVTRPTLEGDQDEDPSDEIPLPTSFNMGVAYDVFTSETSNLLLTAQISNPSDNTERLSIGAEYSFMSRFFLRTGYRFGIEEEKIPAAGVGTNFDMLGRKLTVDYSYNNFERLGATHRVALKIEL